MTDVSRYEQEARFLPSKTIVLDLFNTDTTKNPTWSLKLSNYVENVIGMEFVSISFYGIGADESDPDGGAPHVPLFIVEIGGDAESMTDEVAIAGYKATRDTAEIQRGHVVHLTSSGYEAKEYSTINFPYGYVQDGNTPIKHLRKLVVKVTTTDTAVPPIFTRMTLVLRALTPLVVPTQRKEAAVDHAHVEVSQPAYDACDGYAITRQRGPTGIY